jgi:Putative RNA methylase family UPF0020.
MTDQLQLFTEMNKSNSRSFYSPEIFGRDLPYLHVPFSKRSWGHPLHSLCSYQGKMKPAQAHWLVRAFSSPTDVIVDPLGGVGTVALEAALQGRRSITNDLSPFPAAVSAAKISPPDLSVIETYYGEFWLNVENTNISQEDYDDAEFGLNSSVKDYYHPKTLEEVLRVRRYFLNKNNLSHEDVFLRACMLHILHGNRPYALSRNSHPITPFAPKGEFVYRSVKEKIRNRYLGVLEPGLPDIFIPGESYHDDFRRLPSRVENAADLIITSPPFVGMRFDRPNWLRLWFCGWSENDFHQKSLGHLERQQRKNPNVYSEFFRSCADMSKSKSMLIMHLGGSKNYDMIENMISCSRGFYRHTHTIEEDVRYVENHGIGDKGQTTSNYLMFFEKA